MARVFFCNPTWNSRRFSIRFAHEFAAMGGESRAEGCEPKSPRFRMALDGILQRCQHTRAAHVSIVPKNLPGFLEGVGMERAFEGIDHIPTTGMGENAVGFGGALLEKPRDRLRGESWNLPVELVFEAAVGIDEPDFFPVLGLMQRLEVRELPSVGSVLRAPESGGRTVSEKTKTHQDSGIVIEVERGGAHFDGDRRDQGAGIGGKVAACRLQEGKGGSASEAQEILEKDVLTHPEEFRHMAGWAGAEVAGAAADQKGIDVAGIHPGFFAGFLERCGRESRGVPFIQGMEAAGVELENRWEVGFTETPGFDAGVAE